MARNHEVVLDKEKCIGCGLCSSDCVANAVSIVEGKASFNSISCIACGHCEAICPKNAVTLTGFTEQSVEYESQVRLDPKTLLDAIKTRRTIRNFTDREISGEILHDIIEAGRLAPTGGNSQSTGYVILGSRQGEFEALSVGLFSKLIRFAGLFVPFLRTMNIDEHFFFKKAPLVIVITGDKVNASLAAQNMAFMAESHGLGVLFSGFFTMCTKRIRKIRREVGKNAVTTLVIGYPSVKYHRTVRREPAKVRTL